MSYPISVASILIVQRLTSLPEVKNSFLDLVHVRIICDPKPEEGSAVESFLEELREVPQFHFA